ncbi:hypothetical protein GOV04_00005, partial [Candidatus Woesearchaeota archaeon]|nr:hypothetical protein [Candidatus Woesearchaeota archaeon]
IGGEVDPTACCTDDTGENKELEVSGTDAPALFDDGTDACCNLATDCIEAGTCYSTTVTFGSFPNEGYCNAGTWQGGDAGSTQCSAVGGFWNIGGEVDPTLCCEDDTGENRDIETQGSDAPALFDDGTDACCNLATDCIEAGTCYSTTVTFGSFPNEGYCNAGTWLGGDASQTACDAIIGSSGQWNIGGEVDPTLCCEDDSGEYFKQNATYGTDACCDQPTDEVDASGNCDGGTLLILGVGTNLANVTVNDPVLLWANYSDVELLAEITGATVIINITYLATLPVVTEAVMNYNATSERYEYTFNPQNLGLYEFTVKANKTGYSTRIETLQFSITTGQLQGYLSASPQVVKNGDAINFSYIAYKANYTVLLNTSTVSNELLPMGDMNQDGIYTASTTVNNNGDEIVTVVATVYFELDTWTVSTTVIVDNTPPETAVVLIDDDNSITYNQFVELKLNYSDTNGISACRYANNLTVLSNTLFEDCTPVKTWKLTDGIGAKTLFFEVKDNAGNTIVVNDTILYDRVEEALLIIRPEPDANLKETYNVEIVAPSDTTKVRTELINSSGTVVTINDVDLSDGWNATINTLLYNDGLYNLTVTSYSTILYLLETQTAQRTIPINIVNWVTLSQAPLAVVDDGNYTNTNTSLHFSWYNATSRTQVTYEYRLWNSTIENLTGWIIAWQDTEANVAGSYVEGTQYILEVRYSDIYYNYVNSSFSDGIYVDATAPITYAIDSTTHVNLTWDSDTTGFFNFSGFDETSFAGFSYAFTDNGIATPDSIMDEGINFTITNLADGTHYLFVRSIDEAGNAGNVQNFTVMVDSTKPSTPQMIQGNASGSTSVTFNWTESVDSQSGVDNYYLQIASDQNFTTIIEQGWVGNTLGNTTSLAQGTYFARVKSRNRAGVESYWSSDAPQDVDTTNPSILFNKPVGTVKSATPVIVVMTDEWAYCTYTISGQTYPFRFTNSTYHEVQVSGSGVVNYDVDCYDKVNRQASTSDAFTVDTASQPDGLTLSINDPFYIGEIIDVDVNVTDGGTRIGDINPLDFSLSIDNSQVLDFAVVDNGNGIYTLSFNSPQTPKTYSIEIIVLGYSINDSMSVTPIYLTTQYDAASPATQNKLAYVKTSNYTIGVGSDATTTNIDSATLKVEGDSLGNNYIFLTPPNANVRRHDARLEEKTFLELSNPRFGTASTDEYVVQTMLDYENIILSGNQKVGSGFYSIVITNNGLTSDGKVNITISII